MNVHGSIGPPWARAALCLESPMSVDQRMRYSEEDGSVYTIAAEARMLAAMERYFMMNRKGV